MIDKFLETNKDILIKLLQLSGLEDIDIENIRAVELGGRSYCWICDKVITLHDYKGCIFIKIDMDIDAFSFVSKFKEGDQKRKQQIDTTLNVYSAEITQIPKTLYKLKIPAFIEKIKIPDYLVGKNIYFQELIRGIEPKSFLINPSIFEKHCVKYYPSHIIEEMFKIVSDFHMFSQKKQRCC